MGLFQKNKPPTNTPPPTSVLPYMGLYFPLDFQCAYEREYVDQEVSAGRMVILNSRVLTQNEILRVNSLVSNFGDYGYAQRRLIIELLLELRRRQ